MIIMDKVLKPFQANGKEYKNGDLYDFSTARCYSSLLSQRYIRALTDKELREIEAQKVQETKHFNDKFNKGGKTNGYNKQT